MITVKYSPSRHQLSIRGHAGAGEKGHDIVCASASMVFYNLCQMLREYDQKKAFALPLQMQDAPGNASIRVMPHTGYETWIDHDFLYALTGFRMLMAQYPDYVNLIVTKH